MDRIENPKRDTKNIINKQRAALKNKKPEKKSALKVVYISSPMKVKTRASNFRSLVQELTGRESDVVKLMDFDNHTRDDDEGFKWVDDFDHVAAARTGVYYDHHHHDQTVKRGVPTDLESPTSTSNSSLSGSGSGSGLGSGLVVFDNQTFDDLFNVPDMFGESCDGLLFPSGFLYDESFSDDAGFVRNYELM